MMINRDQWDREELERHSVDLRQFADFRQSTLSDGMRIIEAYNGSGLVFTILPDRGLDIWAASYNGLPLTWISQGSPFPPDFGQRWLRQFNGGLLTTCGLRHVGPPETDPISGEWRDLHGLYSRLRATDVRITRQWVAGDECRERYVIALHGVIAEAEMHGEQLRLERTYRLMLGEPVVDLVDTVCNVNDVASPLMVLYHFNAGFPLVAAGTRLHTPYASVYPREETAQAGLARWAEYDAATPHYAEQVFFHHVKVDQAGWSEAAFLHDDFGLTFQWDAHALPYLTQWKNTRQGMYVCGVEPGNCIPEGQIAARASGRLRMIEPGESIAFACRLKVLDGAGAVQAARQRIDALQQTGTPVPGGELADYAV